ncbi:hypothetical protein ACOMHN_011804 [Nucella lapillus]
MATRRAWTAFTYLFRTLKQPNGRLRCSLHTIRQQYARYPQLLLAIPAAGLLRSFSLFKSSKQSIDPEAQSPDTEMQKTLERADTMYEDQKLDELLTLLRGLNDSKKDEVLWRMARALNEKSKRVDDKGEKKKLICEAFEFAKQALALNDKNFACHKWYAILMDKTAEYEGTKARISNAYVVKEHFLKASELNPKDATTHYTLGMWCFLFADMPWYQRKIAGALFASPPTSTYDEALKHFHQAEETEPNFFSKNLLMLGKTYSRTGDKKLAMLYLTRTYEFTVSTPDDKEAHKEAEELLTKLGVKLDKSK